MFTHLTLASLAFSTVRAATSGEFSFLSLNVAGQPDLSSGEKVTNAYSIGKELAGYDYDVVHVQEDLRYHGYIYASDNHRFQTQTSGRYGDGLNTFANFEWLDSARVHWDECSNNSKDKCYGFTFMRLHIDEGVYIDTYNLAADYGTGSGDEVVRAANFQQLANFIDTWSIGNSVIVFGNTNSGYAHTPSDGITILQTQNGLKDAWVQIEQGGVNPTIETNCDEPTWVTTCESVDKVLYRASTPLFLNATDFSYESKQFLQSDGAMISLHNPIAVNFTWSVSDFSKQSDLYGGPHGTWFNDIVSMPQIPKASVLRFKGAERLDSVGVALSDGTVFEHGGGGGDQSVLNLGSNEYWTQAELCKSQHEGETRNFFILATTSDGNSISAGTRTNTCATFTAPSGFQIVGFMGREGDEIDQLAFLYALRAG